MDCDCTVRTTGSVALVEVRLRNPTPVARRVRVENRLAGPVLPPRTAGVPEAGWDETGVAVVVAPHDTRALGYACPRDAGTDATDSLPADPPAAVVSDERASTAADNDPPGGEHLPSRRRHAVDATDDSPVQAVVRDLGRPAPPRDAVPSDDHGTSAESVATPDLPTPRPARDAPDGTALSTVDSDALGSPDHDSSDVPDHDTPDAHDDTPPPPVETWLAAVERRLAVAERLGPETSVSTATTAVGRLDGRPADLPARLDADSRLLADLADRLERLAARADAASVPAEQLRRLS
jgi:hypothetical protein